MSRVEATPTSIAVSWAAISVANGYLVHINDTIYNLIGSDNTSVTLDEQIPGTTYSIEVRAYQDILGLPNSITAATTDDGKYL